MKNTVYVLFFLFSTFAIDFFGWMNAFWIKLIIHFWILNRPFCFQSKRGIPGKMTLWLISIFPSLRTQNGCCSCLFCALLSPFLRRVQGKHLTAPGGSLCNSFGQNSTVMSHCLGCYLYLIPKRKGFKTCWHPDVTFCLLSFFFFF